MCSNGTSVCARSGLLTRAVCFAPLPLRAEPIAKDALIAALQRFLPPHLAALVCMSKKGGAGGAAEAAKRAAAAAAAAAKAGPIASPSAAPYASTPSSPPM